MMTWLLPEIWNYSGGKTDTFKTDNEECAKEVFTLLQNYAIWKEGKMEDYKKRMINEYRELKERYDKLHAMLVMRGMRNDI